jgi:hypothetical protein
LGCGTARRNIEFISLNFMILDNHSVRNLTYGEIPCRRDNRIA